MLAGNPCGDRHCNRAVTETGFDSLELIRVSAASFVGEGKEGVSAGVDCGAVFGKDVSYTCSSAGVPCDLVIAAGIVAWSEYSCGGDAGQDHFGADRQSDRTVAKTGLGRLELIAVSTVTFTGEGVEGVRAAIDYSAVFGKDISYTRSSAGGPTDLIVAVNAAARSGHPGRHNAGQGNSGADRQGGRTVAITGFGRLELITVSAVAFTGKGIEGVRAGVDYGTVFGKDVCCTRGLTGIPTDLIIAVNAAAWGGYPGGHDAGQGNFGADWRRGRTIVKICFGRPYLVNVGSVASAGDVERGVSASINSGAVFGEHVGGTYWSILAPGDLVAAG